MDYFKLWYEDKESILNTMICNLKADLDAGYSYFGNSAKRQRGEIEAYKYQFDQEIEFLKTLDEKKVNHWCRLDLIKRGAISA